MHAHAHAHAHMHPCLKLVAEGKEAPLTFKLDQEVFVQLYSQKSTGRAHVIGLPDDAVRLACESIYRSLEE